MAQLFSARFIAEEALRKARVYSQADSAARPEHLAIALNWLDLLMANLVGQQELLWLTSETYTIALDTLETDGAVALSRELSNALSTQSPIDQYEFLRNVTLLDAGGNRTPLTIYNRDQFESVTDKNLTGTPAAVYLDRTDHPKLFIHPRPAVTTFSLEVVMMLFSNQVAAQAMSGNARSSGEKLHGLKLSWQLWAIYELGRHLGMGTLTRLPENYLTELQTEAGNAKRALLAFDNRETASQPIIIGAYDVALPTVGGTVNVNSDGWH